MLSNCFNCIFLIFLVLNTYRCIYRSTSDWKIGKHGKNAETETENKEGYLTLQKQLLLNLTCL